MFAVPSTFLMFWAALGWAFSASYVILGFALLIKLLTGWHAKRSPLWIAVILYAVAMGIASYVGYRNTLPNGFEIAMYATPIVLAPCLVLLSKAVARLC